jgi:transcriptional regulator with XRE-family HTH domain
MAKLVPPDSGTIFSDNLARLAGLHRIGYSELGRALGVSAQSMSLWLSGRRSPSVPSLLGLAEFFGLSASQLMNHRFSDLLEAIADPARFEATEKKIARLRSGLKLA